MQRSPIDEFPYLSTIRPVFGERMVVASQPLAAQAGLHILDNGGNAVDAAVAAAAVIAVVEPTNNGIGGDAFAMVWDGSRLRGLNATGRAPQKSDLARMAQRNGGKMPQRGWDSVTVPGAISAWSSLSGEYGSIPFPQLLESAIHYASQGFFVSPGVAQKWAEQAAELSGQPNFSRTFLPSGSAPKVGEVFKQPELAETLRRVAGSHGQDFYEGSTARLMAGYAADCGADLSLEDLAAHRANWTEVLNARFKDTLVFEMPPNGQGLVALYALAILDHLDIAGFDPDSAMALHLQIEAIKLAFAHVAPLLGDPRNMAADSAELLSAARVARAAALIDPDRAIDFGHIPPPIAGTVYLAAGDASGMMVSFIQSNYMGFGSGVVVPETGIALQNRGAGFSLDPDSPARLAPGARPFHTILPGFLRRDNGAMAAFGATGGKFQPQGHVQLVARLAGYGQNPQAIVDAPRFKVNEGLRVVLEPGFNEHTKQKLAALGHEVTAQKTSTWDFGGMQILMRRNGCYMGARDARRDSHVAVS
ncbi:gamma-glutamyltransferase family protein [Paralcaligenes sp. KSB-10]|uniref:gamma-glutamyltransferase family protein n=1 Tax=Paralcaligenes sp. KSB-10 TaxID=2901142 RepID=UPI001E45B7C9|nr:gamma-glutamyltransferase family protein [Paralcaligenes sp. KSB-10]UHL63049.1 gamma-glutamyltransferase family protein [Paralcaligenes sp. KSB-10]